MALTWVDHCLALGLRSHLPSMCTSWKAGIVPVSNYMPHEREPLATQQRQEGPQPGRTWGYELLAGRKQLARCVREGTTTVMPGWASWRVKQAEAKSGIH